MNFSKIKVKERLHAQASTTPKTKRKVGITIFKSLLVILVVGLIAGVCAGYGIFRSILDDAPDISLIDAVKPKGHYSTIYDANGNVMQKLVKEGTNREDVSYDQIPQNLVNAFIAIEDSRFREHNGVDIKGILRAAMVGITTGDFSEGGSTITQQLIKNNIFDGGLETNFAEKLKRKIQEQYLALKLEEQLDKNTIIQYYLNTINLGSNTLGVQSASKRYFNKDVSELTLSECAVLAAITQNPSLYNPIRHPDQNKQKREIVLNYMLQDNMISQEEYDEAMRDDVYSRIQMTPTDTSSTQVFSYFTDTVFEEVAADLQSQLGYTETQAYNLLYSGGLSIYTTMDPDIQEIVDKETNAPDNYPITQYSMSYSITLQHKDGSTDTYNESDLENYFRNTLGQTNFHLLFDDTESMDSYIEQFKQFIVGSSDTIRSESLTPILEPQVSMFIMDQSNGHVLALTGGRGEKTGSLTLNRATDSKRQPGSCFKVITTFAPALDSGGATLASTYYDSPYTVDNHSISNWWGTDYVGYANIRQGIAYSMNIIASKCMMDTVTPAVGIDYAEDFGITTLVPEDRTPSLALGGITYGVYNSELTAAYAAIANGGVYTEPVYYTRVLDQNGQVILESEPETHTVIKSSTASLLTKAMEDTISGDSPWRSHGIAPTGELCQIPDMSLAGKSGSTTDHNDLWFVGYSPYVTCGIWSGYDESVTLGSEGDYHKVIWQKVMAQIHEGKTDIGFEQANDLEVATICSKSGQLAVKDVCDKDDGCVVYNEYFAKGTAPTTKCTRHVSYSVCEISDRLSTSWCPKNVVENRVYTVVDPKDLGDDPLNPAITDDTKNAVPYNLTSYCNVHKEPETEEETRRQDDTDETQKNNDSKRETNKSDDNDSGKETTSLPSSDESSSQKDDTTSPSDETDDETQSSNHFWEFWKN